MASIFKTFSPSDKTTTRTLLHESIPITGSIVSGTYAEPGDTSPPDGASNIVNYSHGLFQSVYDYPYLSSSANHIFDIAVGVSPSSSLYSSITNQQTAKRNMYNQMAQVLMGYDHTGSIREFDRDGDFTSTGDKIRECFFINFSRLLTKDEIKKGSFSITFYTSSHGDGTGVPTSASIIQDVGAATAYKINSPVGEYGVLYSGSAADTAPVGNSYDDPVGLIFYQAGVCVLTASVFSSYPHGTIDGTSIFGANERLALSVEDILTGSSVNFLANSLRHRLKTLSFNNVTELNSSIWYCRAKNHEYNMSANNTYLSSSQIRVKSTPSDSPVSYITTVGLYSENNELLACAKLSEAIKKTPENEISFRVRLDW